MHRDDAGGDADDVYRSPGIAICLPKTHLENPLVMIPSPDIPGTMGS
jgi:hypothetical protein